MSYNIRALYDNCYTKEDIKGIFFDDQLPDEFVSRSNVENVFEDIDTDLNAIEYDLNSIKGLAEIDSIKEEVQKLRKQLV